MQVSTRLTSLRLPGAGGKVVPPMSQSSTVPEALFEPVESERSSDRVAEAIRRTIFDGRLPPGASLPPERTLAERFRVTRNTVREALRHLEQLRLVRIRQGSGVTVQDYLATAGIELVSTLVAPEHGASKALLADLLEARAVVGRAICRHAVDAFGRSALGPLEQAVERFSAVATRPSPDPRELQVLDFDVQNQLVRAGGNQVFVLLHNSLRHVYERVAHLFTPVVAEPRALDRHYRALVTALRARDRPAARRAVDAVFDLGAPRAQRKERP